jgi:hypothetical protein
MPNPKTSWFTIHLRLLSSHLNDHWVGQKDIFGEMVSFIQWVADLIDEVFKRINGQTVMSSFISL